MIGTALDCVARFVDSAAEGVTTLASHAVGPMVFGDPVRRPRNHSLKMVRIGITIRTIARNSCLKKSDR